MFWCTIRFHNWPNIKSRLWRKQNTDDIKKKEMKELLLLCTKNVHFSFSDIIYQQCDGIEKGSPLGLVLAGIFMVQLERTLIPKLTKQMNLWKG